MLHRHRGELVSVLRHGEMSRQCVVTVSSKATDALPTPGDLVDTDINRARLPPLELS